MIGLGWGFLLGAGTIVVVIADTGVVVTTWGFPSTCICVQNINDNDCLLANTNASRSLFASSDRELLHIRIYSKFTSCKHKISSDDRVVRASASGAADSGLIPSRVTPMTFKIGIHSFLT